MVPTQHLLEGVVNKSWQRQPRFEDEPQSGEASVLQDSRRLDSRDCMEEPRTPKTSESWMRGKEKREVGPSEVAVESVSIVL